MITLTLVAILGVLLVIVLRQLSTTPAPQHPAPAPAQAAPARDLANLKIADTRPGDAVSISGAGDDMTDLDFNVERLTRFQAGAQRWSEITGAYRERRVALRTAGEDESEVFLDSGLRPLTLEDIGVSETDLAEMDERQNTADYFEFDKAVWAFRMSREASTWRTDSAPRGFYYWEFRERGGKRMIAIRKPEGEPFAPALYTQVPAADVTLYPAAARQSA